MLSQVCFNLKKEENRKLRRNTWNLGARRGWTFYRVDREEGFLRRWSLCINLKAMRSEYVDDWVGNRKDGWMDDGWMEGREERREREKAGWWYGWKDGGWLDWESERIDTWIVLIYADDSIYLHHRFCACCILPPVLQCQSQKPPVARLHPYFPAQDP